MKPSGTSLPPPRCRTLARLVLAAACGLVAGLRAETLLPLTNPGFEDRLSGWSGPETPPMCAVAEAAAHSGQLGLRVADNSGTQGSSLRSTEVPATELRTYALRFWSRTVAGEGLGVYLDFHDAGGKSLTTASGRHEIVFGVPGEAREWRQFVLVGQAPEGTRSASVWVHSFNAAAVTADLDDLTLAELTDEEAKTVTTTRVRSERDAFPVPKAERLSELAAMLPAAPRGLGDPAARRERWDRLARLPAAATILRRAGDAMETEPPELPDDLYLDFSRTGNRDRYQRPYGQRSSRIATFVVAECLENRGRFLPALRRDILAMCGERSWTMPAHDSGLSNFEGSHLTIDLGSSARSWLLATADWLLGEGLGDGVRERLRTECRRRVLDVYLAAVRGGEIRGNWWMRGNNNWNAVCTAGVVGTALALVESPLERAEFLAAMESSNPYFLSGFTEDGYCSEGMGYWSYGFGHYLMLGDMVRKATGGRLNILEPTPKLVRIASFPLHITIQPGVVPAFADCGVGARPDSDALALIHRHLPEAVAGPVRVDPLGSPIHTGFFGFEEDTFEIAEVQTEFPELPLRSWFADAGILVTRSAADAATAFGAAFKGGHNGEHHNHNDVGSFVVALGGTAYVLDPGGEVYTRRTFSRERYESNVLNSYGHPVPLVAGKRQASGGQARAKVLESAFSDDVDRLALDLKACYPVPEIELLVREFEHRRGAPEIAVRDRVRFTSPQAFGTALVTYERVHRREDGTVVIYDARQALCVTVETEGMEADFEVEEIENPGRRSPKRLAFNATAPVREAVIQLTLRPGALEGDLPGLYTPPRIGPGFQPDPAAAITVEAEAFTAQQGGEVEIGDKVGASGQAFKFWDKPGHALTWTFDVPRAGRYAIQVRACHAFNGDVSRQVLLDGNRVGNPDAPVWFPHTGGWATTDDDWQDLYLAQRGQPLTVEIGAGRHTLSLVNDSEGGLNLDWLRLVPLR
ncbi:MAG: heparinase II/III family protein [Lentisphaeria bacterium]|nr:heparinase II/III family protein [Lentisphaeria bacterium]